MKQWQVEIAIFASGKQAHFSLEAESLSGAKTAAMVWLRKFIPDRKNLYLEARGDKVYTIVSELYDVGLLSLRCCKDRLVAEGSLT